MGAITGAALAQDIAPSHSTEGGPYHPTFRDEFNSLSIQNPLDGGAASNTSRGWWTPIYHYGGWPLDQNFVYNPDNKIWHHTNYPNREAQFYAWNDYRLDDGQTVEEAGEAVFGLRDSALLIRARPMTAHERDHLSRPEPDLLQYVSGMISSYGTFAQEGGYWEMRARLPVEDPEAGDRAGLWPAFWLVDNDNWGYQREIDIIEFVARNPDKPALGWGFDTIFTNFHDYQDSSQSTGNNGAGFPGGARADDGFHTYSVEWLVESGGYGILIWRIDGTEVFRTRRLMSGPMSMHINLAVGGGWPGYPHAGNRWPAELQIDYVRVFSLNRPAAVLGPQMAAAPAPSAHAGADQTVREGDLVTLDGSQSQDPAGGPLTYTWRQQAGTPVTLDLEDPVHPTFVVPAVAPGGAILTFSLVVEGTGGTSGEDTVDIRVFEENGAPVADAGPDRTGASGAGTPVPEGATVTLDGSGSYDPDGDPLTCRWEQVEGVTVTLADPGACTATFLAPVVAVGDEERLRFELTVDDGTLSSPPDEVVIVVVATNLRPTAVAAAPEGATALPGATVVLDGSRSSDPDGDPLTFAWRQISGQSVLLSDPTGQATTFAAPDPAPADALLEFELTVSDVALSSTDTVAVRIEDEPATLACRDVEARPSLLWPPNGKLHTIDILVQGGHPLLTFIEVKQDEPVTGLDQRDQSPDAVIQANAAGDRLVLRAERDEYGDGRVYRARFLADDSDGMCVGEAVVAVPIKRNDPVIESGEEVDSTSGGSAGARLQTVEARGVKGRGKRR
ncbi:MAG TPA: PKD domain-containing protein [Geminicoccaceae bacterium]